MIRLSHHLDKREGKEKEWRETDGKAVERESRWKKEKGENNMFSVSEFLLACVLWFSSPAKKQINSLTHFQ